MEMGLDCLLNQSQSKRLTSIEHAMRFLRGLEEVIANHQHVITAESKDIREERIY